MLVTKFLFVVTNICHRRFVVENYPDQVFPAEYTETVRSNIPGSAAILICFFRFIDQVFINLIRNAYDICTLAKISEFLHFFQSKYLAKRIIWIVDDNCFEFWTFQGFQFIKIDLPRFIWVIFIWLEFDKLWYSSSKFDHGKIAVEKWFNNDNFISGINNCLAD